jgi:hypothetical protein
MNVSLFLLVVCVFMFVCLVSYNVETFVNVYNSPGLHQGGYYPYCPQGFYPNRQVGKCVQFCRGCKTGICDSGYCSHV